MSKLTKLFILQLVWLNILLSCKSRSILATGTALPESVPKASIRFQQRKVFHFNQGTVAFSNTFAGARLNQVTQLNDSTFKLLIEPENTPVNPSPWYAFKIWSAHKRRYTLQLTYVGTKHRYDPKLQLKNGAWKDVQPIEVSKDGNLASFGLEAGADSLLIAAQELMTSHDEYQWEDSLIKLPFIKRMQIGKSILGKPINALNITEGNGKKLIVILSRQHPPEVTGYMAMQEFIRTVSGSSALASNFRKAYEVVLIPMINPDGVDEGNWRHNVAGVDLNRDWENFIQPETRSVRNYILKKVDRQQAKVYFGIDFHSTYHDVFYTNEDQPLQQTNRPGFTLKWLNAFSESIPGFKPNIKPSPNGGNVSKSWMGRNLNAEALTYEVGDDTPRPTLKMKGRVAAEKMMELLLAEK
ncbi:M14 family metallopeptidase [Pedobacter sp. KLB.chiD]|uniref:M14 family metallopeptidase n=1 Tax=Pedobacter sp. KLB.chiD TaxID=3387402 RepID=UPI00399BD436